MNDRNSKQRFGTMMLLFALGPMLSGCAYFKNRGHDVLQMTDLGITVNDSWIPRFSLYLDPFLIIPVGFSSVEGRFLGISYNQYGNLDYSMHCLGLGVWGSEKRSVGEFDPTERYAARPDQRDLKEAARYNVGVVGLVAGEKPPGWQFTMIKRSVHVGYIGIDMTCRFPELIDFLLGWTTLDIMNDDKY